MSTPPIPLCLLREAVTVDRCTGRDRWQKPIYDGELLTRVHLHRRGDEGTLYVDARHSRPTLDWHRAQRESLLAGAPIRIEAAGRRYAVDEVNAVSDPLGGVHHWEVSLIPWA